MDRISQIIGIIQAGRKDVHDEKFSTIPVRALIAIGIATDSSYLNRLQTTFNIHPTTLKDNLQAMVGQGLISQIGTANRTHLTGPPPIPYVFAKGINFRVGSSAIHILPGEQRLVEYPFSIMNKGSLIPMVAVFTSNIGTKPLWEYDF